MNLSNCQGLSLTAVSPLIACMAPWAPEIHRGINLLKSTVELSFGKMCISTYSLRKWGRWRREGQREKLTHKVVSLSHLWRAQSCPKLSHRNHVILSSLDRLLIEKEHHLGWYRSLWLRQFPVGDSANIPKSWGTSPLTLIRGPEHSTLVSISPLST